MVLFEETQLDYLAKLLSVLNGTDGEDFCFIGKIEFWLDGEMRGTLEATNDTCWLWLFDPSKTVDTSPPS